MHHNHTYYSDNQKTMKQEDDFNNQVTGYTQRKDTSETVSQNVFSPFSCIQGSKCKPKLVLFSS